MNSGSRQPPSADDVQSAIEAYRTFSEAFQTNIVNPLAEAVLAVRNLFAPIHAALSEVTPEQWANLAQAFKGGVEEYCKRLDAEEAEVANLLTKCGWLGMERHFTIVEVRALLAAHNHGGDDALGKFVLDFFRANDLQLLTSMIGTWTSIPYFEQRRTVLTDALDAHRKQQFTLTVPALLPFAEGLSAEILGKPQVNAVTVLAKQISDADQETWSQVFLGVICDTFYKFYKFGEQTAPYLNRHGILHGRTSDYATEANSLRVFLLLDVLADLWHEQQRP